MRKARVEAVCMTGPSARGSLNGMPTSIMDMPRRCSVRIMREVSSAEVLPAQKYRDNSPPFSPLRWRNILVILFMYCLLY